MADSTLAVTAGSGTSLKTSLVDSGANHAQYVRELQPDTAAAPASWTLSTTAGTSIIAANADRLGVLLINNGTVRVYIRFDGTAPTSAAGGHHWWLDPSDRWEVPAWASRFAMSFVAAAGPSGGLTYFLGTKA